MIDDAKKGAQLGSRAGWVLGAVAALLAVFVLAVATVVAVGLLHDAPCGLLENQCEATDASRFKANALGALGVVSGLGGLVCAGACLAASAGRDATRVATIGAFVGLGALILWLLALAVLPAPTQPV